MAAKMTTKPSSSTGRIARSAGAVSGAVMCSRVLGLVREQIFAGLFGAGYAYDAFVVAFRIPNLLRDLFGEGALDIRDVEVAWREHESLLVRGLTDADELVLSDVVPAIAGTALRRAEEHPGGEAASTEASPEDAADDDTRPETP